MAGCCSVRASYPCYCCPSEASGTHCRTHLFLRLQVACAGQHLLPAQPTPPHVPHSFPQPRILGGGFAAALVSILIVGGLPISANVSVMIRVVVATVGTAGTVRVEVVTDNVVVVLAGAVVGAAVSLAVVVVGLVGVVVVTALVAGLAAARAVVRRAEVSAVADADTGAGRMRCLP